MLKGAIAMLSISTIYVFFALITMLAGLAAGWWLRGRGTRPQQSAPGTDEVRRARELLSCLQKLASSVAAGLGEHSTRVEEMSVELQNDRLHEPAKILNVVTRLVDANKTMQGRLDQAEDRLREQVRLVESSAAEAHTDALTLVGNRRAFEADISRRLADYRRTGQPFALAMIDLDKFKRLNDTYGHQAGDEVLRTSGRVMRRVLRESDSIARYGGEEFAVILTCTTIADVQQTLTRLRKAIARSVFDFPGGRPQVTISVGAAQILAEEDQDGIVARADAALYASKEAGRNCGHWHDGKEIHPILDQEAATSATAVEVTQAGVVAEPAASGAVAKEPVVADPAVDRLAVDLPALPNRTAFCQNVRGRVAEWKRGGPMVTVVLIEVDRIENLALSHGAQFRDLLVTSLLRVVFAGIRQMDMVARYSTSCLAFLLPRAELDDALRIADRLREAATHVRIRSGESQVGFTVSVGLVEACSAEDLVALFRKAEMALEAGHRWGGNCVFYHDGEHPQLAATIADARS
jgi:diguanylate cyclase